MHKPCGQLWGEGVSEMSTLLIKGGWGQKGPKNGPHGLCMPPNILNHYDMKKPRHSITL